MEDKGDKMLFLRTLTSAVAGIIVFSVILEIIAPDGEIKKYIRLVLGMVITITLINPLGKINIRKAAGTIYDYNKALALKQQKNFSEEENDKIIEIYKGKLENKIYEKLKTQVKGDIKIFVEVYKENQDNFGEIKDIYVVVTQKEGFTDYTNIIKKILGEDFGISEERIRLKYVKG